MGKEHGGEKRNEALLTSDLDLDLDSSLDRHGGLREPLVRVRDW